MHVINSSEISTPQKYIAATALKAEKRFLIWLNLQPTSRLTFAENLIFSVLARKTASQRGLAKLTALCRKRTIPDAIERLSRLDLCEHKDGRYLAHEPKDLKDWITWDNPKAKRWQDKVTYFRIYRLQPSSGLTARQNALFCKILDWPGKLPAYYATCLGLSRRTVFDQLSKLRSLGLIAKDGCRVPESIPDLWMSKPATITVVSTYMRKYFHEMQDGWLQPEMAIKKIEQTSEKLTSHFGHTPKYLRRYWNETFHALHDSNRIEAFVQESGRITDYVIAKGRTRKYLKTTRDLVVKQLAAWPLDRTMYWSFDPTTLFKTL